MIALDNKAGGILSQKASKRDLGQKGIQFSSQRERIPDEAGIAGGSFARIAKGPSGYGSTFARPRS